MSHLGLQRFFDTVDDADYDYAEFYCCDINSQWVTFRELYTECYIISNSVLFCLTSRHISEFVLKRDSCTSQMDKVMTVSIFSMVIRS